MAKTNERNDLWSCNAHLVANEYGSYVNREDKFYICPFCGEPVYCEDWTEEDFDNFICPICEDIDKEN